MRPAMADPVSASTTMPAVSQTPLPRYQTIEATRDPLPVSSTRSLNETLEARGEQTAVSRNKDFEDYLNNTSILTTTSTTRSIVFDPIQELERQSIYLQPGMRQPI